MWGLLWRLQPHRTKNKDRWQNQLQRRTEQVKAANFDVDQLIIIKTSFLKKNPSKTLYDSVRVCPFAGYVEEEKIGCLIHPSRHPEGKDIRDISVHSQAVCAGHFCAAHDWLRPVEIAMINTCRGDFYGILVAQVGLVKKLRACIEEELRKPLTVQDCETNLNAFQNFWQTVEQWPYASTNPRRFGAFVYIGKSGDAKTALSAQRFFNPELGKFWWQALDELASELHQPYQAAEALQCLQQTVTQLTSALVASTD